MDKFLIVVGELHQDLYYENDFYEQLVEKISNRLNTFVRYNPDDLNKRLFDKIVKEAFSQTPKKIPGKCFLVRGGNGNNTSEYLAKLGVPTKLVSVIGKDSEWMLRELESMGVNTSGVFQIDHMTPISTIIKSPFTTKIHTAINLKEKMIFDGITIQDALFDNGKILYSTPIAEKFTLILEKAKNNGLITAFNIETQKVTSLEQLSGLVKDKHDLFFMNVKDAEVILDKKLNLDEIDEKLNNFAQIRVYTDGKEGSHVKTDHFSLYSPAPKVKVVDRTGAGDTYAAGFLSKLYELVNDKPQLEELFKGENADRLKNILEQCIQFGSHTAGFKISKNKVPTKENIEEFINSFK